MSVQANSVMGRYIIRALRKLFIYWPPRREARKQALVSSGAVKTAIEWYKCQECGQVYPRKETHVDHVIPVVDPRVGFVDYDTYIDRLFCSVDNLIVKCKACHGKKTKAENKERREVKKGSRRRAKV